AAWRCGDPARLASTGGKQPQRRLVLAPVVVGLRGGPARPWPLWGEQQRGGPPALPRGPPPPAAGHPRPGARAARGGPPDAGDVLPWLAADRLHSGRQPGSVRRQPQCRHPGYGDIVGQIVEAGHGLSFGPAYEPGPYPPPAPSRQGRPPKSGCRGFYDIWVLTGLR